MITFSVFSLFFNKLGQARKSRSWSSTLADCAGPICFKFWGEGTASSLPLPLKGENNERN